MGRLGKVDAPAQTEKQPDQAGQSGQQRWIRAMAEATKT